MIDWKSLAVEVGAIQDGNEMGSSLFAQKAIEQLIGVQNIREAVDYYIGGGPGAELARSVLWQIHSGAAMEYCYEIYKSDSDIERRRYAIELLRVVADQRVIPWLEEFLIDPDRSIRGWAFGIIDQLLWSEIVEEAKVAALIALAEHNADDDLMDNIKFVKNYLQRRKERERILEEYAKD